MLPTSCRSSGTTCVGRFTFRVIHSFVAESTAMSIRQLHIMQVSRTLTRYAHAIRRVFARRTLVRKRFQVFIAILVSSGVTFGYACVRNF